MSDRHAGYIVTLQRDIREDDAKATRNAIRHIKGVLRVEPVHGSPEVTIAYARAWSSLWQKMVEMMKDHQRGDDWEQEEG